jgi:hypothetical protein
MLGKKILFYTKIDTAHSFNLSNQTDAFPLLNLLLNGLFSSSSFFISFLFFFDTYRLKILF